MTVTPWGNTAGVCARIATQRRVCAGHTKLSIQVSVAWSQLRYRLPTFITCLPRMNHPRLLTTNLTLLSICIYWHPSLTYLCSQLLTSTNMIIHSARLLYSTPLKPPPVSSLNLSPSPPLGSTAERCSPLQLKFSNIRQRKKAHLKTPFCLFHPSPTLQIASWVTRGTQEDPWSLKCQLNRIKWCFSISYNKSSFFSINFSKYITRPPQPYFLIWSDNHHHALNPLKRNKKTILIIYFLSNMAKRSLAGGTRVTTAHCCRGDRLTFLLSVLVKQWLNAFQFSLWHRFVLSGQPVCGGLRDSAKWWFIGCLQVIRKSYKT